MVDPPSELEQERYYYGLPSQPKLIARSSISPWQFQQEEWPIRKMLRPVFKHKIVGLWNNSTGPLRQDILAAVASLNWIALDVLRIGYDDVFASESTEHPITLFISVEKDSTSWPVGYGIVQRCRQILQQYDLADVHVDMKESSITLLMPAAPTSPATPTPPTPPTIPKLTAATLEEPLDFHGLFSEYLGHCIASSDLAPEGTKCLYLRDVSSGKILALTCRHVAFPNEDPDVEYRHNETTLGRTILQPGYTFLDERIISFAAAVESEKNGIKKLDENKTMIKENKDSLLGRRRQTLAILEQDKRALEELKDPATRIIGHLLFAPTFGFGTTKRGAQRLRDWALIELHQEKHSTDLNMLQNRVVAPEWLKLRLADVERAEFGTSNCELIFDGTNTVPLLGIISERELYDGYLQEQSRRLDASAIMVLKYGRKTGLTVGLANQVKSVLRFPRPDSTSQLSEEWCILGFRDGVLRTADLFSAGGDSGACVWDVQGRIGGMICAGLKIHSRKPST